MKTIRLKVKVNSTFASFPKGDMLFGHFANYLFLKKDQRLQDYLSVNPKIIFSDFLPLGYLLKPSLPLDSFGVDVSEKKEFRKKHWIKVDDLQNGEIKKVESLKFYEQKLVTKNSLNRITFSTDDENFAPYALEELEFLYQPSLYVQFNEDFKEDEIIEILNQIGLNGFGKKSSIGKGYFSVEKDSSFKGFKEVKDSNYYLTLSPCIPIGAKDAYYEVFNRFGKFSNFMAPFKKPVLMAESGAVVELDENKKYIGLALNNGYENKTSFLQAYSILVPFKFDGFNKSNEGDK